MSTLNENTILIPNKLCEQAGITALWKSTNELGVYAYERKHPNAVDKPSQHSPTQASIFQVRTEALFKPTLRKLVNEANGTFLHLQAVAGDKEVNLATELLPISRQYRSIIRACLENLQEEICRAETPEREELESHITIFYSVECIWHLCEILFIDNVPGGIVLPHLQEWVRFHFPKYERVAATMLAGDLVGIEAKPEYWTTVIGCLLQGRVSVARALIKLHSAADSTAFKVAEQTLKAMPIYNVLSGMSVQEFNLQWEHWLMDAKAKVSSNTFTAYKNVDQIMKIVTGDQLAWCQVQTYCETWYEYLAAWLFYTEPTVKAYELGQFAKECIGIMGFKKHMKHLDRVLLAAMQYDLLEVIKEVQQMNENGWFATHLTNMLLHSGKLKRLEKDLDRFSSTSLHDSILLDYATLLMGHKSLWHVGLSYLDHCKTDGCNAIELLLTKVPLDSERKTQALLKEAQKRNAPTVVQTICKVQGMKSIRQGRLGNALTWALKSQDGMFVSFLADKFLREYLATKELMCTDLLYNLGSCILASDRLIFLGKFYEFHKLYQEGQFKEAANLLIRLLESKIVPKYFWHVLLTSAIPLLESESIILSSNDSYTILNCLQENENCVDLKGKLDLLRIAVARNLSRAIVHEAQLV